MLQYGCGNFRNSEIVWFESKGQSTDFFNQAQSCILVIGVPVTDNAPRNVLPYRYKLEGRELADHEYGQIQNQHGEGSFKLEVFDDKENLLFHEYYDSRTTANDVLDAITNTLNNANVKHHWTCIDCNLQLDAL